MNRSFKISAPLLLSVACCFATIPALATGDPGIEEYGDYDDRPNQVYQTYGSPSYMGATASAISGRENWLDDRHDTIVFRFLGEPGTVIRDFKIGFNTYGATGTDSFGATASLKSLDLTKPTLFSADFTQSDNEFLLLSVKNVALQTGESYALFVGTTGSTDLTRAGLYSVYITASSVPEPSALLLMLVGGVALTGARRHRR
jgi:hypothetical protein